MRLFKTIAGLRSSLQHKPPDQTIGFVPTMGALHPGHLSLIKRAVSENDLVVVSIFINPLQFGPTEDWEKYPHQLEADLQLCKSEGVDFIFAPTPAEMGITGLGDSQTSSRVLPPPQMTAVLCGPFRPVHFSGVTTIITKLFQIVQPNIAYFGEKDAQQLAIIRRLVKDLNLNVEIRACPIVREPSGLAYSSRNQYLSPKAKEDARVLYRSLQKAQQAFSEGDRQAEKLISIVKQELATVSTVKPEYIELVHPSTLIPVAKVEKAGLLAIAAWLDSTRLIDNVILRVRKPIIAIDGPAGAGKSTITRRIAQALGLVYLDTGAMYRAVTWLVMRAGISLDDQAAIAELISDLDLQLIPSSTTDVPSPVIINNQDVTEAIRSPEVTKYVSPISAIGAVRKKLVKLQQSWGETGGLVAEGRDIGTNVFPDAELKIFLTASVEERSKRRLKDLQNQGFSAVNLEELAEEIAQRDNQDSQRKISPLQKAPDAIIVNTDGLTIEEVTNKIINLYQNQNK